MNNNSINILLSLLSMTLTTEHPKGFDYAMEYCINKAKELDTPKDILEHLQNILVAQSTCKLW